MLLPCFDVSHARGCDWRKSGFDVSHVDVAFDIGRRRVTAWWVPLGNRCRTRVGVGFWFLGFWRDFQNSIRRRWMTTALDFRCRLGVHKMAYGVTAKECRQNPLTKYHISCTFFKNIRNREQLFAALVKHVASCFTWFRRTIFHSRLRL